MLRQYRVNKEDIDICGTFGLGSFHVSYEKLLKIFGEPLPGSSKTDAEWTIQFDDGLVATIYNWKDGRNYLGEDGMDVEDIIDWHVGGKSTEVFNRLTSLLYPAVTRKG